MNRRLVMILNHSLYRTGRYCQSESLKLAWQLVKHPLRLSIAGVTFENRQVLLKRLAHYPRHLISVRLVREPNNSFDSHAVQIVVHVEGKRSACIGYLPKEWSRVFAPVLDRGFQLQVMFESVVGGRELGAYGARVTVKAA